MICESVHKRRYQHRAALLAHREVILPKAVQKGADAAVASTAGIPTPPHGWQQWRISPGVGGCVLSIKRLPQVHCQQSLSSDSDHITIDAILITIAANPSSNSASIPYRRSILNAFNLNESQTRAFHPVSNPLCSCLVVRRKIRELTFNVGDMRRRPRWTAQDDQQLPCHHGAAVLLHGIIFLCFWVY
jgi:hypothetical protein